MAERPYRRPGGGRRYYPHRVWLSNGCHMSQRFGLGLMLTGLAWTTPALAHSPIMGVSGIPGGALHAVLIPEHGLGLLALGLVLGQQAWPQRRDVLLIFAALLA